MYTTVSYKPWSHHQLFMIKYKTLCNFAIACLLLQMAFEKDKDRWIILLYHLTFTFPLQKEIHKTFFFKSDQSISSTLPITIYSKIVDIQRILSCPKSVINYLFYNNTVT